MYSFLNPAHIKVNHLSISASAEKLPQISLWVLVYQSKDKNAKLVIKCKEYLAD